MRLYGLRLLVALLTFVAGIALSSLFGLMNAPCASRRVVVDTPVVAAPARESPRKSCSMKRHFFAEAGALDDRAVSKPRPAYPQRARAANVKGSVVVRVLVDAYGRVISAAADSGPAPLREAAEEAAYRATFSPRVSDESRVNGTLTYDFGLE